MRTAGPGALVVFGGMAGNGVDMGFPGESRNFLQAIYDTGGRGYFDVVAIHPYLHPIGQGVAELLARVRDTRAVLAANGEAAKPMWLTEIGWPTAPLSGQPLIPTIAETVAASWLRTIYQRRADLGADKIFWYNLRDGQDPLNPEDHNGLLRRDLAAKPAYLAYREVTGAASLPVPGTPANLTASTSASTVTITWNAPATGSPPDSYTMEVGSAPGLSNLAILPTPATTFTAASVPSGTYYIRVRARNGFGASAPSNEIALVVGSGACSAAPGSPTNLQAVTSSNGTVTFTWTPAAANPTSYVIEAGSSPGANDVAGVTLASAAPALTVSSVARGTYYVRVRGRNSCGTGPASNEVRVDVSF